MKKKERAFFYSFLHENQRCIATLGEMIHTASLIHDDVVDSSDRRRGKPAAAVKWGPKKVIFIIMNISIR
jgi:geranylgeranyl pyrophosphate synthase